ncbi:MAG TPA: lactaldehyde reductase [Rectinemataceae bacterium]|nr:lactaldehyde reductase [Rectinemataceae bacterium]
MTIRRMIFNETSYFGPGARRMLPEEIGKRHLKKAFVVTDKELLEHNVTQLVLNTLESAGIPYITYDDVKPNPTIQNVQRGVDKYRASDTDFIIAVGGGSAIDTAKGIGIIMNNPEFYDVRSLYGLSPTKNRSVPVIALPTTAGTAAEVTINYVITDLSIPKKYPCIDPNDLPILAIVDPELMVSQPKGLTASVGMDALTHAIEGYIAKDAWEMSDMFGLKAISLISRHLETAVSRPVDIAARDGMGVAQYIAGMGFSNVGLGLVHAMAHQLGAYYNIAHGVANALLLPYIMEYNAPAVEEKFRDIAIAMGVEEAKAMTGREASYAAVNAVRALSIRIGIPQKLSEIGIKEEDLPVLAASAMKDPCISGNPRDPSIDEVLGLFRAAYA